MTWFGSFSYLLVFDFHVVFSSDHAVYNHSLTNNCFLLYIIILCLTVNFTSKQKSQVNIIKHVSNRILDLNLVIISGLSKSGCPNNKIDSISHLNLQVSIKRFLKINLAHVGMAQCMNALVDKVQKQEVPCTQ